MSIRKVLQFHFPSWSDWVVLIFMSMAALWIAAFIHSLHVIRSGFRLYNAEIGGIYFRPDASNPPMALTVLASFVGSILPAIPTFLVLVPFRNRPEYRWVIWACSIGLWTWCCFKMEIAYR
jgi:hypothetical protein